MNPTYSARSSNRDALLNALESILAEGGVHLVTLDEVASRAGITKGGLIYHFKSKEALLVGLVERMYSRLEANCAPPGADPHSLKHFLTARIHYAFGLSEREKRLMGSLLVASSTYPAVMGPVRRMYETGTEALARFQDSAGVGLSVWTTLDGFVLLEMLNIRRFTEQEKQQMQATLLAMVEQQFADTPAERTDAD
ncbi:TetR/AcrR family transcriptional regulator [Oxalobacteraceae bacterium A2-2]